MLSSAVAEFYGVKDPEKREDLVRYLNGMISFAETRKPTVEIFFGGITFAVDEMRALRQQNAATRSEMQKMAEEYKHDFTTATKLSEKLDETNRTLMNTNTELKKQIASVSLSKAAGDCIIKELEEKLQKEKSTLEKLQAQVDTLSNDVKRAKTEREAQTMRIVDPTNAQQVEQIVAEYERLQSALSAMTAAAVLDPPTATGDKTRNVPLKEHAKLRDDYAKQGAKLEALGRQVVSQSRTDTEKITKLAARVAELEESNKRLLEELEAAKKDNDRPAKKQRVDMAQDQRLKEARPVAVRSLMKSSTEYMLCPVPIRTGFIMELQDIFERWKTTMSIDFQGTALATFVCPHTGEHTMLASREIIHMMHQIAADIRISYRPAARMQYMDGTSVREFLIMDQIAIMSMCCYLYRAQVRALCVSVAASLTYGPAGTQEPDDGAGAHGGFSFQYRSGE